MLTALADHLTAHGPVREMPAGPLPGTYDPTGPGKPWSAFFAAMAGTEPENIREPTLERPRGTSVQPLAPGMITVGRCCDRERSPGPARSVRSCCFPPP
ncbi:hypothetical protein SGRIM128S_01873 [Streptomyces griseomycini]